MRKSHLLGILFVADRLSVFALLHWLERVFNVGPFLSETGDLALEQAFRTGQSMGRPLMANDPPAVLEKRMQRRLSPATRGWPRKKQKDSQYMEISVKRRVSA